MQSENGRKGALYELLYENDLVLMAGIEKELEAKFIYWKTAFDGKGSKVNLDKTKLMEDGRVENGYCFIKGLPHAVYVVKELEWCV